MTIQELIDELTDALEDHGDIEVRLATQKSWPFENAIACASAIDLNDDPESDDATFNADDANVVFFIAEGRQLGYLPSSAANTLNW